MNPREYGQLVYDGGGRSIQWGKDSLVNEWCWENWMDKCRGEKRDHFLAPYTWVNSRWIKDWDVGPQGIKLLEENRGSGVFDVALSNIFGDVSPQARGKRKQM